MHPAVHKAIQAYHGKINEIPTDTLGSYTGMTEKGYPPAQDADDL